MYPSIYSYVCNCELTGRDDSLKSPACVELVNNCPHVTSLSLRGFKLHDYKVRILIKVCLGHFEKIISQRLHLWLVLLFVHNIILRE